MSFVGVSLSSHPALRIIAHFLVIAPSTGVLLALGLKTTHLWHVNAMLLAVSGLSHERRWIYF